MASWYDGLLVWACISQNIPLLQSYYAKGVDLNNVYDDMGDTLLQVAIKYNKPDSFNALIEMGVNVDEPSLLDGTTALNLAAIGNAQYYIPLLVELGADVNTQDDNGFTPLNNAILNQHYDVAEYFLTSPDVDVNIAGNGVVPVLFAYGYDQWGIVDKIIEHPQYDATFTYIMIKDFNKISELTDYIKSSGEVDEAMVALYDEAKLFALKYDIPGEFVLKNVDAHESGFAFEGYSNTLGIEAIWHAYDQFYQQTKSNLGLPDWAINAFSSVHESLAFSKNCSDPNLYLAKIAAGDAVLITSGWNGHSIDVVIQGSHLYRCNRGEDSDGEHGIEEFIITKPENLTAPLIDLILNNAYGGAPSVLQADLIETLGLQKIGEVQNPTQTAGNCVWTSLETGVEALFITTFLSMGMDVSTAHHLAKQTFLLWEDFEMDMVLNDLIIHPDLFIEYEILDDLLIGALENHHDHKNANDVQHGVVILDNLSEPTVFATFDEKIGQYVMEYDPTAYYKISYLEPYTPSWSEYFWSYVYSPPKNLSPDEEALAKEYLDFLAACDAHQAQHPELILSYDDVIYHEVNNVLNQLFNGPIISDTPNNTHHETVIMPEPYMISVPILEEHLSHQEISL